MVLHKSIIWQMCIVGGVSINTLHHTFLHIPQFPFDCALKLSQSNFVFLSPNLWVFPPFDSSQYFFVTAISISFRPDIYHSATAVSISLHPDFPPFCDSSYRYHFRVL